MKTLLAATALLCALLAAGTFHAQEELPSNGLRSAEEHVLFIEGVTRRKMYGDALKYADEFLRLYPKHPLSERAGLCKIQALAGLARYKEAAAAIQEHLGEYPESQNRKAFTMLLADCLRESGDYKGAVPPYRELLKNSKGDEAEETRFKLAVCLVNLGENDEGEALMKEIAALPPDPARPDRIAARMHLVTTAANNGRRPEALAMCRELASVEGFTDDTRKNILLTAGFLAFSPPVQDYAQAEQFFGAFATEFPKDDNITEVRRNLLSCHYGLKHYREYLELYARLCESTPKAAEDRDLQWLAASAMTALGRYSDAEPLLEKLTEDQQIAPGKRRQALYTRILCLNQLGKGGEIVAAGKKYRTLYPDAPDSDEILFMVAVNEERLGRTDDAIASSRELMPLLAAGDPAEYQKAGLFLAQLLLKKQDYKAAADLLLQLADRAPEKTGPEGRLLTRRQLQREALAPLSKLDADPRGLKTAERLASEEQDADEKAKLLKIAFNFALGLNNTQAAEKSLDEIIRLATPAEMPEWLTRRATLERSAGKFDEAIDDYTKALAHENTTPEIRKNILPELIALLYYRHKDSLAKPLLGEVFADSSQVILSEQLMKTIAGRALAEPDYAAAILPLRRLLKAKDATPDSRAKYGTYLAYALMMNGNHDSAKSVIEELSREAAAQGMTPSCDGNSMLAEIALAEGRPDEALVLGRQALGGKDRPLLRDTIARARWATAKALLELGDNKGAFEYAAQSFILDKIPAYSPRCYLIAAQAKENLGDKKTAEELRDTLQREFPDATGK